MRIYIFIYHIKKKKQFLLLLEISSSILPQESQKQLNEWDIKHNPISSATLPAYRKMNMLFARSDTGETRHV
jgi:hypothetical protein